MMRTRSTAATPAAAAPAAPTPATEAPPAPTATPTGVPLGGSDEDKFSTRSQWQERSSRPVAARPMTVSELEEFRSILQINEGVTPEGTGVSFTFVPIVNRADEDAGEYIHLIYKSATRIGPGGTFQPTDVWRMKIPIPEHIKRQYDEALRASGYYNTPAPVRRRPAIAPAPTQTPSKPAPKRR